MKIALYGKNSDSIRSLVKSAKLIIDQEKPDLIISYGGDGTILTSEREFPLIPKLPIRDSKTCVKCPSHRIEQVLEKLINGNLKLVKVAKLNLNSAGQSINALNDIVLRNSTPTHAVRFRLFKNKVQAGNSVFVGDGVVFSTSFGSTGYFKSITGQSFNKDFGIAFNNLTEKVAPIYFSAKDKFEIEIVRGPALLSVDNNPEIIELKEGNKFKVEVSSEVALIYQPQSLRCKKCQVFKERRLS